MKMRKTYTLSACSFLSNFEIKRSRSSSPHTKAMQFAVVSISFTVGITISILFIFFRQSVKTHSPREGLPIECKQKAPRIPHKAFCIFRA